MLWGDDPVPSGSIDSWATKESDAYRLKPLAARRDRGQGRQSQVLRSTCTSIFRLWHLHAVLPPGRADAAARPRRPPCTPRSTRGAASPRRRRFCRPPPRRATRRASRGSRRPTRPARPRASPRRCAGGTPAPLPTRALSPPRAPHPLLKHYSRRANSGLRAAAGRGACAAPKLVSLRFAWRVWACRRVGQVRSMRCALRRDRPITRSALDARCEQGSPRGAKPAGASFRTIAPFLFRFARQLDGLPCWLP